ncbi:hypothetical protein ES705_33324 [subsurface metagenome]
MPISITNALRQSAKFNAVQIIGNLISIPKSIIVASILLPKDYGVISFLGLWMMYSGLVNPGILSAGQREIPYFLGRNEEGKALRVQNVSITGDLFYSLLPFLVILLSSFFFSNPVIKIGLIITAFSFIIGRFVNYWPGINLLKQNFTLVAKGNLIASISSIIIISSLIYWLRVYAVLIAPIIVSLILGIYYWRKGDIGYRFQFNLDEIKRLAKVGIILALGTLAFWGYKMADRTIIAAKLPLGELGLYAYAMTFIMLGVNLFSDFGRVLQPVLWESSGKVENINKAFGDTKRIAIYLAVVTGVIIPFSQLCFYLLVKLVTKKYVGSIPVFYVLSYNFYLFSLSIIPSIILTSKIIDLQKVPTILYSVGLGLNIIFDLLVIHFGYGVLGIAWVTIITQGLITFILYFFVRKYVFTKIKEFIAFLFYISTPLLISIIFYLFHNFLGSIGLNHGTFAAVSFITQGIVWSFVIGIFYRKYFPREKVVVMVKEFTRFVIGGSRKR